MPVERSLSAPWRPGDGRLLLRGRSPASEYPGAHRRSEDSAYTARWSSSARTASRARRDAGKASKFSELSQKATISPDPGRGPKSIPRGAAEARRAGASWRGKRLQVNSGRQYPGSAHQNARPGACPRSVRWRPSFRLRFIYGKPLCRGPDIYKPILNWHNPGFGLAIKLKPAFLCWRQA